MRRMGAILNLDLSGAEDFIASVNKRDTPCDMYGCARRRDCAEQLLACDAFRYYVQTGAAKNPRLLIPLRVTRNCQPTWGTEPAPTREIYDAIMGEDA